MAAHKTPSSCPGGCCDDSCFDCTSDNWNGRCCKWYGYPESLASALSGATLNFGPLEYNDVFNSPDQYWWVSNTLSIPGSFVTDADQRVSNYVALRTGYNWQIEGTARLVFTIDNVKIRIRMRRDTSYIGDVAGDTCKRRAYYQIKWRQTITDIPSCNVVVKNGYTGVVVRLITDPTQLRWGQNVSTPAVGYTEEYPGWTNNSLNTVERDLTVQMGGSQFDSSYYAYAGDCDATWLKIAARPVMWQNFGGGISATPFWFNFPLQVQTQPGWGPAQCWLETPHWVGTGVYRFLYENGSYSWGNVFGGNPLPPRPPFEIKRSTTWGKCAVDATNEAIAAGAAKTDASVNDEE